MTKSKMTICLATVLCFGIAAHSNAKELTWQQSSVSGLLLTAIRRYFPHRSGCRCADHRFGTGLEYNSVSVTKFYERAERESAICADRASVYVC